MTKIGEVYVTLSETDAPRYLQLVAIDEVSMNSDVVIIYGEGFQPDNLQETPSDWFSFYTHTTVSDGIRQGLWKKVGIHTVPDLSQLVFKLYFGMEEAEIQADYEQEYGKDETSPDIPYPNWTTWTPLDARWRYITVDDGNDLIAEDGGIVPAEDIIYRIKNGHSSFPLDWPVKE